MKSLFKKQETAAKRIPQIFTEAAAEFEKSKIEEIKFSRKIAWSVAGFSGVIGVLGVVCALVALLHRTEPEPTILQVDKSTGATTVMRSVRDSQDHYNEVINKYWLATYVRRREGYDWFTISEDFEAVKLMSDSDAEKEYIQKVYLPSSPLTLLKETGKIKVEIISIAFFGETAQIRYTSEKLNPSGENMDGSPVQKWIATVAYQFKPSLQMTEQQRLTNPLGFRVVSYRVDPENIK